MKARDYQHKAALAVIEQWREVRSTLVVMPTGTGKTILFADIIRRCFPKRALVLAHREELIFQARDKIHRVTGYQVEVEMADLRASLTGLQGRTHVVVSTIQTQTAGGDGGGRMGKFMPTDFALLIIDESHHACAASYRRVIDYYGQNPNLKILGVTATPDRADEEALGQIFQSVAFDYEVLDAIRDGWLVPVEQQVVEIDGLDFSSVRTTAGDLNGADLAAVMEAEKPLHGIADATLEIAGNRRCLVFAASVKQAEQLAEIFNRHRAGSAGWVCGKTPKEDRRRLLADFAAGTLQFVVNVGVLTEGFDDPGVELVVMGRPTKSRALYAQMIGRATRPLAGVVDDADDSPEHRRAAIAASRKPSCLVVDFAGNAGRHKLMTCIAEGQLVLTSKGLVPIEEITDKMFLWDGLDFVPNSGVVYRHEQNTITYAGLTATEDHKVWTQEGWKTFGECAIKQIPIALTEHDGVPIREADGYFRRGFQKNKLKQIAAILANRMHMWRTIAKTVRQPFARGCRLLSMCVERLSAGMAPETMLGSKTEMRKRKLPRICKLWRTRNQIPIRFSKSNGAMDHEKPWVAERINAGQNKQRWTLRTGESSVEQRERELGKSQGIVGSRNEGISHRISRLQSFRRSITEIVKPWIHLERNNINATKKKTAKVYDILDCGPRHRFTVNGLLVSNCADILGGNVSDEAVELAASMARKAGKPMRMDETLQAAEEELKKREERRQADAARRARLVAKAQFSVQSVDPFNVLEITPQKARGWDAGRALSEKQRNLIVKHYPGVNVDQLPFTQGKQLLQELFRRWDAKLCTFKQARILAKRGYDTKNMTMAEAGKILDGLFGNKRTAV